MPSAMRSMWKGVIQFGLVAVPVKLHLATDPHTTGAHLLLHVDASVGTPAEDLVLALRVRDRSRRNSPRVRGGAGPVGHRH